MELMNGSGKETLTSEGHTSVLYGVTIEGTGKRVVSPIAPTSKSGFTQKRPCSRTKLKQFKESIEQANQSSWLLPAQQEWCMGGALQPLPQRERQLPANWLSQQHKNRQGSRCSHSQAMGCIDMNAATGFAQSPCLHVEHDALLPQQPSGPYAQSYGVLPYRNVRHKKHVAEPKPWRVAAAWKASEVNQGKGRQLSEHQQHRTIPCINSQEQLAAMQQAANQSIEMLYSQEDLTGPTQCHESITPPRSQVVTFRSVPEAYNCHSSLRRIAWERTLRSALHAMVNAQELVQLQRVSLNPWTSPAQLASVPTMEVCPSSGFNYFVVRYPTGRGFTRRLLHPNSSSCAERPLQHSRLSSSSPRACATEQGARDSEGHQCSEQERALECMQHDNGESDTGRDSASQTSSEHALSLHHIPTDVSSDLMPPGTGAAASHLPASAADVADPRQEDEATVAPMDNVEEHVAQGVSGVASLAGPSPLELDDTDTDGASCKRLDKTRNEQQHFTQPEKGDLDGPLVMDLPEYQTCVIPAKGFQRRGAAVQARITARADLMYSAQVLVMPKRAQDGSAQAHPVGTSCPSSAASIDNCTTPRMCLEAADGPAEFDVDISAWISEWNDRATWIQHLGDRARKKDISTPVSQALHQASLDQKTGHQSVMWKLAESEHADDAGLRSVQSSMLVNRDNSKTSQSSGTNSNGIPSSTLPGDRQTGTVCDKSFSMQGAPTNLALHRAMHMRTSSPTSIIPAGDQDWLLQCQTHGQSPAPASWGGSIAGKGRLRGRKTSRKPSVAPVVDVSRSGGAHQVDTGQPTAGPCSPSPSVLDSSHRCTSSRTQDGFSNLRQEHVVHFDENINDAILRDLSRREECDSASDASNSNMHGSISLAGSGLARNDASSSQHHGSVSVCMHGDTWEADGLERQPTTFVGAHEAIQGRYGSVHDGRRKGDHSLLRYDAGLRMAMALQAESYVGVLPQAAARGSVSLRRSKAFVTDSKAHARQAVWKRA